MGKFDGRILLELGTNVGSVDIVKYAKSEGAYVIVADYLPTEKSEAKQYADETSMVSTLDVESVCDLAEKKHIDGIFCGVSESNLLTVYEVSNRLGLPCYFDMEQFRLNHDKLHFKEKCLEYGILTPKLYAITKTDDATLDGLSFPVIVKPNDQSAGIGVAICYNVDELKEKVKRAREVSRSNSAFVEEYIQGDEVNIIYTIKDGKASLSYMKDKLLSEDHPNITSLSDVSISPSKHLSEFVSTQNENVVKFLEKELYPNGTVFLQGLYKDGRIYFIEMGCRMSGGADYKNIEHENGISFLKMLVDIALLGKCDDFDISADNPFFKHVTVKYCLWAREGVIGTISGSEKLRNIPEIISCDCSKKVGDRVVEDGSLRQTVFMFHIFSDTRERLAEVISEIQKCIIVRNTEGENMLYSGFDTTRIL